MAFSGNKERKIDKNWNEIFTKLNVLEKVESDRLFYITSKEINEFIYTKGTRVDARNMTKFDYIDSLPDIFRNNELNILPVSRGKYVIGKFNAYTSISDHQEDFRRNRIEVEFPHWIESLDHRTITSESAIINVTNISGMLKYIFEADFLEETISGRMSSKGFDFYVSDAKTNRRHLINVSNSQIEVDAGFETENSIILVEAKNNINSSFITRQLYYPYRLFNRKFSKKIVPVFLQYRDGLFNFSIFSFKDDEDYNSIQLIERYNFIVGQEDIGMHEIVRLITNVKFVEPPKGVPFPQANSLQRVIEIMMSIYSSEDGYLTIDQLTLDNGFTYRQGDYYANAGRYLGLLNKEKIETYDQSAVFLSDKGLELMNKSNKERRLKIIELIMSHRPFHDVALERLKKGRPLSEKEAFNILKNKSYYLPEFQQTTRSRRASTITQWVNEILEFSNDY